MICSISSDSNSNFSECAKAAVSDEAKNLEIAEWLWKVSEKWTGLSGSEPKKA